MTGRAAAPAMAPVISHHHERPAIKMQIKPATETRAAVPKSGCIRISTVGIPTMIKEQIVCRSFGGRAVFARNAATDRGITTLKNSDG